MGSPGKGGARRSRNNAVVRLPADLGMDSMRQLHGQLLEAADKATPVTLDAAAVARVHGAALQLLCCLFRDRDRAGRETHWSGPTEALRSAAAVVGMTELIRLPQEAA